MLTASGSRNGPPGSELVRCTVFERSRDGNIATAGSDTFLFPEDRGCCGWIFKLESACGIFKAFDDDEGSVVEIDGVVEDLRDQGRSVPAD